MLKRLWMSMIVGALALLLAAPGAAAQEEGPRPVVLVHGFGSNAQAWAAYLGPDGFLARAGLRGFAVGDGQVDGTLDTGNILDPTRRTNTIAQNAAILGEYIAGVKALTGAEQVDLVAHSMGGLISRYYIARVMEGRDVAQLIMLGSPQLGTDCASLPAAAGYYLPATLEIRPSYVVNLFNPQIRARKGVPFHLLAGTTVQSAVQSPCAATPSDLIIARESAGGLDATVDEYPILHADMNRSEALFNDYLLPLLRRPTSAIPTAADPPPPAPPGEPLQFTRVIGGRLAPGEAAEHTIHIDEVVVASFALFDPTRSLAITVRGASGAIIELSAGANGLITVDDPESLLHLGYGFENPRPGPWQVTVSATERTPATGADYAISARLQGGATLELSSSQLLPEPGEPIELATRLTLGGEALPLEEATALVRHPDGTTETIPLADEGDARLATWAAPRPGLYAIDIEARGVGPSGAPIERVGFLAVEAQPPGRSLLPIYLAAAALLALVAGALAWLVRQRRKRARRLA